MHEDDAQFCAKILRHAALGGIIGGPAAVGVGWLAYARYAEAHGLAPLDDPGAAVVGLLVAVLLLGVWIGATVSCGLARARSGEDVCYGGAFGCLLYVVGGALGALIGRALPGVALHPVAWYLIGGTVLALAALAVAVLSPVARDTVRRRQGEEGEAEEKEQCDDR